MFNFDEWYPSLQACWEVMEFLGVLLAFGLISYWLFGGINKRDQ